MSRSLRAAAGALVVALAVVAPPVAGAKGKPPKPGKPTTWTLPGDAVYPEGIAMLPGEHAFVTGSSADGTIFRGDTKTGAVTVFSPAGADGRTVALGIEADKRNDLLFVAGGATKKVAVLDDDSGATQRTYDLSALGAQFLNDLVATKDAVYVTDSLAPFLYRIPTRDGLGEPEKFIDFTGSPLTYGAGFNLNGIEAARGGRILIAIQSNTGKLWRIDTRTKAIEEIATGGADLTGGDGLLLRGRALFVSRNAAGKVVQLRLKGTLRSARAVRTLGDGLRFNTTLAREGSRLYVVNGQLDRRATNDPVLPFAISTIRLGA